MKFDHNNISPLDSRYANKISNFRENFSESALIKIRFEIEIEWILFLCNKLPKTFKPLSKNSIEKIINFKNKFDNKSVLKIKKIEATTNHDVKAVEYFIRDYFKKDKVLSSYIHLIHFGLTSEDVNSLSYAVMIKKGISLYINEISTLNKVLKSYSKKWANVAFLARTHGQPASPSTLGKEFKVFAARLDREISILKSVKPLAKFSGATGNYHTFAVVDNKIKWSQINKKFIKQFSVDQNPYTTQIEPHDWIAEVCHSLIRVNNIMIDLCQDSWIYISNDIFALKLLKNEVGSSTMPHKVNPIDFENAEGNFGISSALLDFFANKLTKSRHQRDLSDSTVLRNIGLGFGYSALAIKSTNNGLNKITPNKEVIDTELNNNWEVLTEAVQTLMRYEGIPDAYEQLKNLSRGSKLDQESYINFINSLKISNDSKNKLLHLKPSLYIGNAKDIAKS
ncbi:MAG: adenylosuccinate lyase [Proteobacteria bacterium]|jgi:adenylosuccinate lyase|nr:adenylosuccinate lyase [Pseudomonadota bacterium]NCV99218.1 adenylosuccinate lyase [Pseudomonadota bacterium]NCW10597.1 adenylosuccinate lyase [Pseudomonadota bacterium]NCW37895.1 adenylosuccinate lyase [Pseudomonadota bacterium]NCX74481.1 adenylosuccinate lyase [Pseudomonadota bacterium]